MSLAGFFLYKYQMPHVYFPMVKGGKQVIFVILIYS